MAAIDFPESPVADDEFTAGGRTWVYDGTAWNAKGVNNIALDNLTDVVIDTPASGQALTYDGTDWVNSTVEALPSQTGNGGELLVTSGTAASWSNTVTANATTAPAIIAKGLASQTGNIQEWQTSEGTVTTAISASGFIDTGYADIDVIRITSPTTTAVPAIIKGASGQTSNLTTWQNSSNATIASVEADGKINAKPIIPGDAQTASNLGYVGMPQTSTSTGLTVNNAYAGKHIYTTATGQTHTIASNASVPMEIGTTIVFINPASVTTSIAITSDTLILAGAGTTGTRTLAPYGMATAVKITSTSWMISGNGLS